MTTCAIYHSGCNWSTKMDISRTYWQFRKSTNCNFHQPQSQITNQLSQGRPGDTLMVSTGPLLPTRLSHECSNFQKSQTFQSASYASATLANLLPHFTLAKPNWVRNRSLGSIHTSKQRSATGTASTILSIKTSRNGLMLVEKETTPSTKPRPKAGRISHTALWLCQLPRGMESYSRSQ